MIFHQSPPSGIARQLLPRSPVKDGLAAIANASRTDRIVVGPALRPEQAEMKGLLDERQPGGWIPLFENSVAVI